LLVQKTSTVGTSGMGICSVLPLDFLMVHLAMLAITADGEFLTCGDFSLDEIVHFGSLEFIIDCFSSLSLSPNWKDTGAIFVGTTRSMPQS
jgi:hypothetical protein